VIDLNLRATILNHEALRVWHSYGKEVNNQGLRIE